MFVVFVKHTILYQTIDKILPFSFPVTKVSWDNIRLTPRHDFDSYGEEEWIHVSVTNVESVWNWVMINKILKIPAGQFNANHLAEFRKHIPISNNGEFGLEFNYSPW